MECYCVVVSLRCTIVKPGYEACNEYTRDNKLPPSLVIMRRAGRKFEVRFKKVMKRTAFLFAVALFCFGCDGEVKVNEEKLDKAGDKLQKTVEKGADSLGAKLDRLEDRLDRDDTLKK